MMTTNTVSEKQTYLTLFGAGNKRPLKTVVTTVAEELPPYLMIHPKSMITNGVYEEEVVVKHSFDQLPDQIKDFVCKTTINLFKDDGIIALGLDLEPIKEVINTEFQHPILGVKRADLSYLLMNETQAHFEFQSTDKKDDTLRFMTYNYFLHKYHGNRQIQTIVIYSADVQKADIELNAGDLSFNPTKIFLGEFPAEEILEGLKQKIKNGEELTNQDCVSICLLPMMRRGIIKLELAKELLTLAQTIKNHEKRQTCIGAIVGFGEKYLSQKEFKELMEVFKVMDVYKAIADSTIQEALAEGIQQGILKGKVEEALEIAEKMLLKNMTISDIIECTNLDEYTVNALKLKLKLHS